MLGIDLGDNNIIDMKYLYYMMSINFYIKSMESFIILSVMWYERLTKCHLLHTDPSEFRELGKTRQVTCFPFIKFEPLDLYWTYFLAFQTTTPKIPPMRFMSLNHEPKMRWCAMSLNHGLQRLFVYIWAPLPLEFYWTYFLAF